MRLKLILLIFCAAVFASCEKTYTCSCTSNGVTVDGEIKAKKRSQAEKACTNTDMMSADCHLK